MTQREFIRSETIRVFDIKISLELTMRRELRTYFNQQRIRIRNGRQTETIEPVLEKHYQRIIRRFTRTKTKQNNRIKDNLQVFISSKATNRAIEIDNTTRALYEDAIRKAEIELAEQGNKTPTEKELLIAASIIFARRSRGRVNTISNTETQNTVEGVRQEITRQAHIELEDVILDRNEKRANELFDISQDYTTYKVKERIRTTEIVILIALLAGARKQWVTMGDNLVRTSPFNHVEANGQVVNINEPYMVSGELLNYPGDVSLGASPGNVVNCRCISIYI